MPVGLLVFGLGYLNYRFENYVLSVEPLGIAVRRGNLVPYLHKNVL